MCWVRKSTRIVLSQTDMTEMIDYEKYTLEEIEPCIDQALSKWVVPAIRNGTEFILSREDLYARVVRKARVPHKFDG